MELEDLTALRYLAGTISHRGMVDDARRWYTEPPFGADDPALRLDYVDLLQELNERDEAIAELNSLRERGVSAADRIVGDIMSEEGDVDRAVAHYMAAVGGGDTKALTNLGVTWREEGRLVDAELALRRSWRSGDVLAGRALGRTLAATGRSEEAREIWRQAAASGDEPSGALLESAVARTPEAVPVVGLRDKKWLRAAVAILDAIELAQGQSDRWLAELHEAQVAHLLSAPNAEAAVVNYLDIVQRNMSNMQRDAVLAELRSVIRDEP